MDFFELLWAYILVFLLAATPFIESYIIIPIAMIGGMSMIPVFLLAFFGNYLTVVLAIGFVEKIKQWRAKRNREVDEGRSSKRTQRAQNLWNKYGLPGLTLIGPLIVGSHLTAFMSVIFGGNRTSVSIWMAISLLVWCIIFTLLGYFGVDYLEIENPFVERLLNKE